MKLIIAGSRHLKPTIEELSYIIKHYKLEPKIVVSGEASGVDTQGKKWAKKNKIPVKKFPAKWIETLKHPEAVIKIRRDGKKYNALAGHWRNQDMAEYADALLLIWDGKSHGSRDMKNRAKKLKLKIYECIVD